MPLLKIRTAPLTAAALAIIAAPASAQNAPTPPTTQPPTPARQPRSGGQRQPETLASFTETLVWDAATRGPLLVVSPEETRHNYSPLRRNAAGAMVITKPLLPPRPDANGGFDLPEVAAYFDRKLVPLPTLNVLAPTMTTLLNDRALPKPDSRAGMSLADRARLLESTFTPEQRQKVCSPTGIGVDDMTPEQRTLYLSLLPEPFALQPVAATPTEYGFDAKRAGASVVLSASQRANVRFRLQKALAWSFNIGHTILLVGGEHSVFPSAGPTYQVELQIGTSLEDVNKAFDTHLTRETESSAKASDLPDSAPALATAIPLGTDATVGDLVHRIAEKTKWELYCDPHYAERNLSLRYNPDQTAQAGDILRALALAVTGTWRRVGPAYVLTDDLEGLGTRQARIADWVTQNIVLADARDRAVTQAITDAHYDDATHWADDDPLRPDAALIAKIDADQKQPSLPDGRPHPRLFIAMSELPAPVQAIVAQQLKGQTDPVKHSGREVIATDGVNVTTQTHAVYLVPGMPTVAAAGVIDMLHGNSVLGERPFRRVARDPNATPPAITYSARCPNRALLIAPHSADEIAHTVQEAHRCGFTELWVQTPRGENALLEKAISLGKASGVSVHAVVRLLQPTPDDRALPLDRILLGETTTAYIQRKRNEIRQLGVGDEVGEDSGKRRHALHGIDPTEWRNGAAAARLLLRGDYLRPDDPATAQKLIADLTKTATLPGLAGLVLRDTAPTGYQRPGLPDDGGSEVGNGLVPIDDPLLALGYTESLRLACLRKNGFDPIDLSPLPLGDNALLFSYGRGGGTEMTLPFFRDTGSMGMTARNPRVSMEPVGVRDAQIHWRDFRADTADALLHTVVDGIHARHPEIPITASNEDLLGRRILWFGSVDARAARATPSAIPQTDPALPHNFVRALDTAKSESKMVYYLVPVGALPADAANDFEARQHLAVGLSAANGWDGVVVDLTEVAPARLAGVLRALPDAGKL